MNASPRKHNALWFPDGNIVLATESLLFRVSKDVLSLHSTVLRDMFNLPVATSPVEESSNTRDHATDRLIRRDLYEGVPMVVLSGDRGEDVVHLLLAIFQRGYYNRDDDTTPLDMIVALFTLSAKYDVPTVRADVQMQLARNYPTTLMEYELLDEDASLFGRTRKECHIPLLRAASFPSQTDARLILPSLFYACACLPVKERLTDEALSLPSPILRTFFLGERHLNNAVRHHLSTFIDIALPVDGCPDHSSAEQCTTSRRRPQTGKMSALLSTSVLSKIKGDNVVDVFYEQRCTSCRRRLTKTLEHARKFMWERIPLYFGFGSWDAVRGTN